MLGKIKGIFLPVLFVFISIFSLFLFRSMPSCTLWKGYNVFYVSKNDSSQTVAEILDKSGCKDYICLENQFFPLDIGINTPEFALSFLESKNSSDYLNRRNDYFFDKSKNYKIYYIPEKFNKAANKACLELNEKHGIKAGMFFSANYPWICLFVCIVFSVLLVIFSKNRLLLSLVLIFPVFLVFSQPYYSVMAGVCLFNLSLFLFVRYWKRRDFISLFRNNFLCMIFPAASGLIFIFSGFKILCLFIMVLLGIFGCLWLFSCMENYLNRRYFFVPKKIISASMFNFITLKMGHILLFCVLSVFLISVYAAFFSEKSSGSHKSESIYVPGSSAQKSELVNFNSYLDWKWKSLSSPYISVNSKVKNLKEIDFPSYEYDENGLLVEKINHLRYDGDFIHHAEEEVCSYKFPALEKLLVNEKHSMKAGYVVPGSQKITIFTIIGLLLAVSLPAGVYIYLRFKTNLKNGEVKQK